MCALLVQRVIQADSGWFHLLTLWSHARNAVLRWAPTVWMKCTLSGRATTLEMYIRAVNKNRLVELYYIVDYGTPSSMYNRMGYFFLLVAQNDLTSLWRSVWSWHIPLRHQTFLMNCLIFLERHHGDVLGMSQAWFWAHMWQQPQREWSGVSQSKDLYIYIFSDNLSQTDARLTWITNNTTIMIMTCRDDWYIGMTCIIYIYVYIIFSIFNIHIIEDIWYMIVHDSILCIYILYDWYITYISIHRSIYHMLISPTSSVPGTSLPRFMAPSSPVPSHEVCSDRWMPGVDGSEIPRRPSTVWMYKKPVNTRISY